MTAVLVRDAFAKVNLVLKVVGRRAPGVPQAGYHELESLVVFAGIGDRLSFAPADSLSLELAGPFADALAGEGDNLVLRAARALAAAAGRSALAAIRLEKNLPVASGIGGGSADAAAALAGLAQLWRLEGLDLAALGARLGADVPVCLDGRACRMAGIGERLAPLPRLPEAWLVLVNPGQSLSTPAVFSRREGPFSPPPSWPAEGFDSLAALAGFVRREGNDLLAPALALCPAIGRVLAAIEASGAAAAGLSGSGATCFGLYAGREEAQAAARRVTLAEPGWWSRAAALRPAAAVEVAA